MKGLYSTCRQHQIWLDHLDGVRAELLKVGDASRVSKPADVNVGHLEADVTNTNSHFKKHKMGDFPSSKAQREQSLIPTCSAADLAAAPSVNHSLTAPAKSSTARYSAAANISRLYLQ